MSANQIDSMRYRLLDRNGALLVVAEGPNAIHALVCYEAAVEGDGPVNIEQEVDGKWLHVVGIGPIQTVGWSADNT